MLQPNPNSLIFFPFPSTTTDNPIDQPTLLLPYWDFPVIEHERESMSQHGYLSSLYSDYFGSPTVTTNHDSTYLPTSLESTINNDDLFSKCSQDDAGTCLLPTQHFELESNSLVLRDNNLLINFDQCNKWLQDLSTVEEDIIETAMREARHYNPSAAKGDVLEIAMKEEKQYDSSTVEEHRIETTTREARQYDPYTVEEHMIETAMREARQQDPYTVEEHTIETAMREARPYNREEKRERIERYKSKRNLRNFNKKIKYECRKTSANNRLRIRGRFAKNGELAKCPVKYIYDTK